MWTSSRSALPTWSMVFHYSMVIRSLTVCSLVVRSFSQPRSQYVESFLPVRSGVPSVFPLKFLPSGASFPLAFSLALSVFHDVLSVSVTSIVLSVSVCANWGPWMCHHSEHSRRSEHSWNYGFWHFMFHMVLCKRLDIHSLTIQTCNRLLSYYRNMWPTYYVVDRSFISITGFLYLHE